MTNNEKYFVVNYKWVVAWHDLTLADAENVLARELEKDKDNTQEREILNWDDDFIL